MQTTATSAFRRTVDAFAAGATTLPQRYFISPEIFAEEPAFALATARQAGA
jgi:hypothetical protein